MKLEPLLSFLADEFSGLRAKNTVAHIAGFHRIQASPGYDDALQYIAGELAAMGIDHSISTFPADGKTETFGWVSPPGWTIRSGSLHEVTPETVRLGSYDIVKQSILGQSGAGDAEAEIIHVGKGDSEACFEGLDLRGKFVLSCGRPASMLAHLKDSGAAGLILYPDVARAEPSYDLVQYSGLFPRADQLSWLPMGFSISRRAADSLLKQLQKGEVRVRGHVDAEFIDNPMQVLEARIAGTDEHAPDVLLTAHLCHPAQSANDNASGSGVLVEIARVLGDLATQGKLANSVRLLWVPEFNGTVPWAAANAPSLQRVLFTLNLDMVGQSPEIIGEPLRVFRVPNSHPVMLNTCFEPLLTMLAEDKRFIAAQGSRRILHWIFDVPSGGSDHLVFQAPPVDVPSAMLGHDDVYWHTDLDTIDKVDSTRLKFVGALTAILALLPTWAFHERERLAEWVMAFSQRALTQASALARSADDRMSRLLLDTALAIETSRAESLAEFLGADRWNVKPHVDALGATHRALTVASGESNPPDEGQADDVKPRRILAGPVRYSWIQDLSQDDRDFLEAKLHCHHGAPPQLLANLADGTRTIPEITVHLSLDFQQVFDVADIERAFTLLQQAGYIKVEN